jgi:hypothetical protein
LNSSEQHTHPRPVGRAKLEAPASISGHDPSSFAVGSWARVLQVLCWFPRASIPKYLKWGILPSRCVLSLFFGGNKCQVRSGQGGLLLT